MLLFTSMLVIIVAQTVLLAYLLNKNASAVTENYVDLRVQTAVDSSALENIKNLSKVTGKVFEIEATVEAVQSGLELANDHINERFKAFHELSDDLLDLIGGQTQLMNDLEMRIVKIEQAKSQNNVNVAQTEASMILSQMQPIVEQEVSTMDNNEQEFTGTPQDMTTPPEVAQDTSEEPLLKAPRQDGDPLITDLRAEPFEEYRDSHGNIHDIPAQGSGYEAFGSQRGQRPIRRSTMRRI